MAVKYCDYTNGNDTTGDGSAGNPYKTIDKASTGLTGGDEVRVAKSAAPTALTGTLAFTLGSSSVVGTGTSFTTELAVGDFIEGGNGLWYEIVTITDNTHLTLYNSSYGYSGSTQSGVSSRKLGVTSTGEASSSSAVIQSVSVSGTGSLSRLKVSGGWNLSNTTQDGMTYFRQMHSTFANRYGYGLDINGKQYLTIEKLGFLRYSKGIRVSQSTNYLTFTDCYFGSIAGYAMDLSGNSYITVTSCKAIDCQSINLYLATGSSITSCVVNGCTFGMFVQTSNAYDCSITSCSFRKNGTGIYVDQGPSDITIDTCTFDDNGYGVQLTTSMYSTVKNCTFTNNTNNSIYGYRTFGNRIIDCSFSNGSAVDVYFFNATDTIFYNCTGIDNVSSSIANIHNEQPVIKFQKFGGVSGDNRCYYGYGVTYRDTANARSGECLKYDPNSATYYISQSFFFKADSGAGQTLSAYIKAEAAFNGDVQGAIYFLGAPITGWTDITPAGDDAYEQKSLIADAGDITEDGILELRIKVRGTAGNVYVDDLATA